MKTLVPPPAETEDAPIGIVALWRVMKRSKWTIFTPMLVLGLLAGLLSLRGAESYTAEAQLILTRDNIDIIELDSPDRETIDYGVVNYAVNLLNSRAIALQVIDRLALLEDPVVNPYVGLDELVYEPGLLRRALYAVGLQQRPDFSDVSVDDTAQGYVLAWLRGTYTAVALPNSNVVLVNVRTHDPDLSANIANGFIESYLDFSFENSQQEATVAIDALTERVQQLRLQMQADQAALQDAQSSLQVPTPEALQALTSELSDLRARQQEVLADLEELQKAGTLLDGVAGQGGEAVAAVFAQTPVLENMPVPSGSAAQDELNRLRGLLSDRADLRSQRFDALEQSRARLEERLSAGRASLSEVSRLEVELETTRAVYASALARLKELVLERGIRNEGGRFLTPAVPPVTADSQYRKRIVVIAMVLGALIGATIVLVREAANESVRKLSDLPGGAGRFPSLYIPRLKTRFPFGGIKREDQLLKSGNTDYSEAVRNCRRIILEQAPSREAIVLSLLSPLPDAGKSTLSVALARSFVLVGKSVLLIDADMRKRSLTQTILGRLPNEGLQQAVEAGAEGISAFIASQADLGLDFLPAGASEKNPADLLETDNFQALIAYLKGAYDVVVIDTPAALLFPEARSVAGLSNQSVILAEYNKTPAAALNDVLADLPSSSLKSLVLALNKSPQTTSANYGVSKGAMAY